jgi:hypothetical protein
VLLRAAVLDGIARQEIDLAFRAWSRPTVRAPATADPLPDPTVDPTTDRATGVGGRS